MDLAPNDTPLSRDTVAQDIREAFGDAAVRPEPPWVRAEPVGRHHGGVEATLARHPSHAGQPTLQFLERLAGKTCVFRPEVERWFWRSSMLAAIEKLQDCDYEPMDFFGTVRALTPDPTAVWSKRLLARSQARGGAGRSLASVPIGLHAFSSPCSAETHGDVWSGSTDYEDYDAQLLRERFTPAQRVAVARFLRLLIEAPGTAARQGTPELSRKTALAYDASQAIAWCWTDDPASTRAAQAIRAEARSYQRPTAEDPLDEDVMVAIEHAFADTPPPIGPAIRYLDEEGSAYAIELDGADWRTLAPWFVDTHFSAFSFMTPAAFRYFLPTVLCHTLGPGSMVDADHLLVGRVVDDWAYRDEARARILTFSTRERAAVADFLRSSRSWSWAPEAHKIAVYDFWDPRTAGTVAPTATLGDPPLTRATVEADIRAAFADAESRPAPPIVRGDLEDSYRHELEAAFQRQPVRLTLHFLAAHAHETSSLRPEAALWFWRSFLLSLLEAPWDHTDRMFGHWNVVLDRVHTAVSLLTPRLNDAGEGFAPDDEARHSRERFTPEQRVAVARFLRLVVEERVFAEGPLAYLASQAIAWCWSDDPDSTGVAQALRNRARTYQRPVAADPDDEDLIDLIVRAFADTPAPVGPLMEPLNDETSVYACELSGADWRTLSPWFLNINAAAFRFMTPAAFRYFLPAALCHTLGPGSDVSPEFHLVDFLVEPSPWRDATLARVVTFSAPERAAIAAFLRSGKRWARNPDACLTAANDYWDPAAGSTVDPDR
jgi:hypothetical protein